MSSPGGRRPPGMIDLHPAADRLRGVLAALGDADLFRPTPCPKASVGDLVDHIGTFAVAFGQKAGGSAADTPGVGGPPPPADAGRLGADWRDRIDADLAAAWDDPAAWEGMTTAGGIEMPSEVAGAVALDELLVHGWDVAVASGQAYDVSDEEVAAARGFVETFADVPRDGTLFGPEVAVDPDAPPFHQLLGLTGRDPAWSPPS